MTSATKRIPVTPETWRELGRLKEAGQSYDELLQEIIRDHHRAKLAEKFRQADEGEGDWVDLDQVD